MRNVELIKRIVAGGMAGGVLGTAVNWIVGYQSSVKWVVLSGATGIVVGLLWPVGRSVVIRLRIEDWRLEQVEIQGLKFISSGMQRRVAWNLFVQISTRIATQPMPEDSGDDGVALTSLYELFQLTRKTISEMEPTPTATGETVETYALDMLNSDLRPFLSKWHPRWDSFLKSRVTSDTNWSMHTEFRVDLRQLQQQITKRARGLAEIAGVKNVDRFFQN